MIEILTLFMWLTTGVHGVELAVSGSVTSAEILLDGHPIGELKQAPWSFTYDFGADLRPRELLVIARDTHGREVDRAVRWINLGISTADAHIEFKTDDEGYPRSARLEWESIGTREPEAAQFTFDGKILPINNPRQVVLPAYDTDLMHSLTATVRFPGQEEIQLSATFGGPHGEELTTELTTIPLILEKGGRLPPTELLGTWFTQNGVHLEVQAAEKGEAEVIIVRDPAAQRYFEDMANSYSTTRIQTGKPVKRRQDAAHRTLLRRVRSAFAFPPRTHASFISPFAVPLYQEEVTAETFPSTASQPADQEGLLWLSHQHPPRDPPVQLADAVALAGVDAQASGRRRAVILILGDAPTDRSYHSVANVRQFLRLLRVPLYIWSMASDKPHPEWGEVRYIGARNGSTAALAKAVRQISRDLTAQRMVWIRGRHLPQKIELSQQASKVRLAGVGMEAAP